MEIRRESHGLALTFHALERQALLRSLDALLQNYRVPPAELSAEDAAVWYSRRGCESVGMSAEETRDWLAQLHGFRGTRLKLLEKCRAALARATKEPCELRLRLEDAPDFMIALNDHRLLMAARHDIGESEMSVQSEDDLIRLKPEQQSALLEISVLAYVIEEILHQLGASFRPSSSPS